MSGKLHFRFALSLLSLLFLTTACASTSQPDPTEVARAVEAEIAVRETGEAEEANQVATSVAGTLTAQPTATATATPLPTDTPPPTNTALPTKTSTPRPTATETRTPAPTSPPVTATASLAPTSASIYGFVSGPDGYLTDIDCSRSSGNCAGVMPPGDISFKFLLLSGPLTPPTLFEDYGLSVEKDGVNVANMFMFVDAGVLMPDSIVEFGASRNFTQAGRYVIRSSGCMTISAAPCGWATLAGTTVTFVIQP